MPVPDGSFPRVLPDRPPRLRVLVGVPDRLAAGLDPFRVGLVAAHGDGVDDLAVGEGVTVPVEVFGQVVGCLRHPGTDDEPQAGLIDFGDALHAPLIAEVAIAAAYAGLDHADPIGAAAAIARGFHAEYPLLEEEIDLLYDLIARSALHAQTLVGVVVESVLARLTDEQLNHLVYDKVEPDLLWIRMNGSIVGSGIGLVIFILLQLVS